jgi:hypothetical protein
MDEKDKTRQNVLSVFILFIPVIYFLQVIIVVFVKHIERNSVGENAFTER